MRRSLPKEAAIPLLVAQLQSSDPWIELSFLVVVICLLLLNLLLAED